jgi:hypothetical protein
MDFGYLKNLPAFKLLRSDNFSFFLGFFYYVFENNDKVAHIELEEKLDDYMFEYDFGTKHPKDYIEDMVKAGYLKRFFEKDVLYYELTKDVYKVMEFVESLEKKEFVGSETKFNILLDILERLNFETLEKNERIEVIESKIAYLKKEIEKLQKEEIVYDERRIKELIFEFLNISKKLLFDFSEIEENFLLLNKQTKEKIISSSVKADVLDFVFKSEEKIKNSNEGKSFLAFWQLLESKKSEEMDEIIDKIVKTTSLTPSQINALENFKNDLRKNGYKILNLINKLIEQLRIFIDEKIYIEHKRVKELIEEISSKVIKLGEIKFDVEIENLKMDINLPFERDFYEVFKDEKFEVKLKEVEINENLEFLVDFVDEEKIKNNIRSFLKIHKKAEITELLKYYNVENIAEIAAYVFMCEKFEHIIYNKKNVYFIKEYKITLPKIVFLRDRNV